jgi:hypothetical protein
MCCRSVSWIQNPTASLVATAILPKGALKKFVSANVLLVRLMVLSPVSQIQVDYTMPI